jgi:hypothetical protein
MRLNGITAEPGTIIGLDTIHQRFLAIADEHMNLRFATAQEATSNAFMHDPRSVVEHLGIPLKPSPYGMVRRFKPVPVTSVKLELLRPNVLPFNRATRRKYGLR